MTRLSSKLVSLVAPAALALASAPARAQSAPATTAPAAAPAPPAADAAPATAGSPGAPDAAPSPAAPVAAAPAAPPPEPPPPVYTHRAALPPLPSNAAYDGPPLLFGGGKPKLGAYASLGVAYTHMLHRDGVVTDLEADVLVEHRLSLGLAGYIFSRTPRGPATYDGVPREFATAYGGLRVRYAFFAEHFPLYASAGVLVGGGVLSLQDRDFRRRNGCGSAWDDDCSEDDDARYAGYFVVQPDLAVHANATRWLRFSLTGGYRVASAANALGYGAAALSGVVAGGSIDIGWF